MYYYCGNTNILISITIMSTADTSIKRLQAFRDEMAKAVVKAAIVPPTDPHLSANYSIRPSSTRCAISPVLRARPAHFVVTPTADPYLWVDSRYFLQGDPDQGAGIELMKGRYPRSAYREPFSATHC